MYINNIHQSILLYVAKVLAEQNKNELFGPLTFTLLNSERFGC